ncbi:Uncharacterised protein [Raoultella ornithinolytica]|nr:Uncharacterised protein [Raoultella ornithinolytica]
MHLEHLPRSPQSDDLALNVSYPKVHKPCSCLLRERQGLKPTLFGRKSQGQSQFEGQSARLQHPAFRRADNTAFQLLRQREGEHVFDVDTDRSGGDDGQRAGVAVADAARPRGRPQRLPLVTCSGNAFHAHCFQGAGRRDTPGKMFHLPFPAAMFDLRVVGEPQDIVRRKGGRVEINLMQPMAGKKKSGVCRLHSVILRQDAGEG